MGRKPKAYTPLTVLDVAEYILQKMGSLTTWKLHKLCYYSQAWSLVWDDKLLFREHIEAWANGPVVPALYERHKGRFSVTQIGGSPETLDLDQQETVDAILRVYGNKSAQWLSELTHSERPWQLARKRDHLGPDERGDTEILLDEMAEYYGGLLDAKED